MTSEPSPRWRTNAFADPRICTVTDDLLFLVADALYAVQIETGEKDWETSISMGARINATESNVFVRQPNETNLRCLAAFDGAEMWETNLSGRFSYLLASDRNAIAPTQTDDGKGLLEAVDIDSGENDWSRRFAAPVTAISSVSDGIVFIDDDRRISLIDEEGGIERWSNEADDYIHSYVAHDGQLSVGHANGLRIIDLQTGIERHQIPMDHGIRTMKPVDGGIITGATDGTASMIGWDGDIRWSTSFSDPITALEKDDDGVYVGNRAGIVVGLDPENGDIEWDSSVAGAVQDLLTHGTSLCGRISDGSIIGLDLTSGEYRWRLTVDESNLSPRIVVRGDDMYLYTGSALVSVDSRDGTVRWKHEFDQILFGDDCVYITHDGMVMSIPLLPDATTRFIDDRDEGDDSVTRIWRGD